MTREPSTLKSQLLRITTLAKLSFTEYLIRLSMIPQASLNKILSRPSLATISRSLRHLSVTAFIRTLRMRLLRCGVLIQTGFTCLSSLSWTQESSIWTLMLTNLFLEWEKEQVQYSTRTNKAAFIQDILSIRLIQLMMDFLLEEICTVTNLSMLSNQQLRTPMTGSECLMWALTQLITSCSLRIKISTLRFTRSPSVEPSTSSSSLVLNLMM